MTEDDFQIKYHDYEVDNLKDAETERDKANKLMGGNCVVVMCLMGHYCLILKRSSEYLKKNGIV